MPISTGIVLFTPPPSIRFGEDKGDRPYPEQHKIDVGNDVDANYIPIFNALKSIAKFSTVVGIYVVKGVVSIIKSNGNRSQYYGETTDEAIQRANKRELKDK